MILGVPILKHFRVSSSSPMTIEHCSSSISLFIAGTTFNLKTRSDGAIASAELTDSSLGLQNRDTIIIVHGFTQSQDAPWISNMVNALLDKVSLPQPTPLSPSLFIAAYSSPLIPCHCSWLHPVIGLSFGQRYGSRSTG